MQSVLVRLVIFMTEPEQREWFLLETDRKLQDETPSCRRICQLIRDTPAAWRMKTICFYLENSSWQETQRTDFFWKELKH